MANPYTMLSLSSSDLTPERKAMAMPRLREIPRAEAPNEYVLRAYDRMFGPDRDPVAEPGTATGTPGNWWTVFANSPELLHEVLVEKAKPLRNNVGPHEAALVTQFNDAF